MIDLPLSPAPAEADAALVDFGLLLTSPLGGPVQRVDRMGNRWRLSVAMPPMKNEALGRQWIAALVQAKTEGARMRFPLQGFDPGSPGDIVVDGAGQTGTTLNVRGVTPNYIFRVGQFLSVVTGGRHHLIMVRAETIANADGEAALPVAPMLRVPHLDGDAVHARPMIEGNMGDEEWSWSMRRARIVGLSFAITEAA